MSTTWIGVASQIGPDLRLTAGSLALLVFPPDGLVSEFEC